MFISEIMSLFQDIPSAGHQRWYQLEGRTAKSSVEGEIKLRLVLATREDRGIPEDDNWTDVRQHEDLMCLFIEHEVRRCKVGDIYVSCVFFPCISLSADKMIILNWESFGYGKNPLIKII